MTETSYDGPYESPYETGDTAEVAPDDAYDPEGLDLAKRMLASVRNQPISKAGPKTPSKKRRVARSKDESRDPMAIGTAMDRLIAEQGWDKQVSVHLILTKWVALVGAVNAEHTRPEGFTEGVLTVRADSTAWASNLRLLAPQLVAKLNESLGQGSVTRVNVLGPDAPSWKKGRRSVPGRGRATPTAEGSGSGPRRRNGL